MAGLAARLLLLRSIIASMLDGGMTAVLSARAPSGTRISGPPLVSVLPMIT